MPKDEFKVGRSLTALICFRIAQFRSITGADPVLIKIHPVVMASWRAELLATGRIKPGQPLRIFEGVRIKPNEQVTICEVE